MSENKKIHVLDKLQVAHVLDQLNNHQELNYDAVFKVYSLTSQALQELVDANIIQGLRSINPIEVLYYCVGEYIYTLAGKSLEEKAKALQDEQYYNSIASVASDKYVTLSMFNHAEKKIANQFIPPMSSLNLYLNFMLNILNNYQKNDPLSTLITDLLIKSVSISRCILGLLIQGYETTAFASWRTLHECECTLLLLEKYGEPLINRYLIHMQYGIVFKNGDTTDEKGTRIFNDMKEEMRELNLKSKDIKKYIEYGWLYSIPGVKEDSTFKLNFRDGLEKLAGLEMYSSRYELSSELIHSTPMLIYSNKEYFYFVTLLSLYESFFRLEKVFVSLFAKRVSQEQLNQYTELRNLYYSQLVNIHKREMLNFQRWQKRKQ